MSMTLSSANEIQSEKLQNSSPDLTLFSPMPSVISLPLWYLHSYNLDVIKHALLHNSQTQQLQIMGQ
jgi:hypothetical protein